MKLNSYINKLAQWINDDITEGVLGTGTTTPTSDDNGLENPDETTAKTVEKELSGNTVKFTYTLYSTDGTYTITEFGLRNSSGEYINRDVFPEITKDGTMDLIIEKTFIIQ